MTKGYHVWSSGAESDRPSSDLSRDPESAESVSRLDPESLTEADEVTGFDPRHGIRIRSGLKSCLRGVPPTAPSAAQ